MWKKIWLFYYEGFKSMTVGKTLWLIIIIKVIIIFAVLRLFFFPRSEAMFMYKKGSDSDKKEQVIITNKSKEN